MSLRRFGQKALRVLFYGTDRFSEVSLRALVSLQLPLVVVTKQCCPIHRMALNVGLETHLWPYRVPPGTFDIGVVVSFGHLIPAESIDACKFGMVNVHPSLLPRWRGAAPLVHTILAYDEYTGVSLITVAKNRFDTGVIVSQKRLEESPRTLEYHTLEQLTAELGADMLVKFLSDVEGSLEKAYPQSSEGATKAPKVKPSMALVDWSHSVVQVDCRRRAISNFEQLFTSYNGLKIRLNLLSLGERPPDPRMLDLLNDARLSPDSLNSPHGQQLFSDGLPRPGYAFYHKKRRLLAIRCADGWVWADRVAPQNFKVMSPTGFYTGFLNKSTVRLLERPLNTPPGKENRAIRIS